MMPGCNLHLALADRVLGGVASASVGPAARAAFLVGSVAPDMGYFPGGEKFLSDLAHYVRSGGLVRALARLATDEVGRAFALGWATHAVADAALHPLINRAAAGLTGGDPAAAAAAHVRVEQGLDGVAAARLRPPALPVLSTGRAAGVVRLVGIAYRTTYGYAPPRRLHASYRAMVRLAPILVAHARWSGWWVGEPLAARPTAPARVAFAALRAAGGLARGAAAGLAAPVAPPGWLTAAVLDLAGSFAARFAALAVEGFAGLADYNLATGETGESARAHPPAVATSRELRRRVERTEWHAPSPPPLLRDRPSGAPIARRVRGAQA
jgi:hypothetical protein